MSSRRSTEPRMASLLPRDVVRTRREPRNRAARRTTISRRSPLQPRRGDVLVRRSAEALGTPERGVSRASSRISLDGPDARKRSSPLRCAAADRHCSFESKQARRTQLDPRSAVLTRARVGRADVKSAARSGLTLLSMGRRAGFLGVSSSVCDPALRNCFLPGGRDADWRFRCEDLPFPVEDQVDLTTELISPLLQVERGPHGEPQAGEEGSRKPRGAVVAFEIELVLVLHARLSLGVDRTRTPGKVEVGSQPGHAERGKVVARADEPALFARAGKVLGRWCIDQGKKAGIRPPWILDIVSGSGH